MERKDAPVVELDVRPHLRQKLEPFQLIMDTVKQLDTNAVFVLHATFKPSPLFGILKIKGLTGKAEQVGKEHWISTFVHKKNKHWLQEEDDAASIDEPALADSDSRTAMDEPSVIALDNRGLESPKPMMRTLAALERSRPGDQVLIHNDRIPMFLIEELHSRGYPYTVDEQPDGTAKVTIRKR